MNRRLLTAAFWADTAERMIRAGASSTLAVLTAETVGLLAVDWGTTASVAGLAAAVSLLTSIVAGTTGDPVTAGFATDSR